LFLHDSSRSTVWGAENSQKGTGETAANPFTAAADRNKMALPGRPLLDSNLHLRASAPGCHRLRRRGATPILLALLAMMASASTRLQGQISDGAGRLADAFVFVTVGGENSQYPDYADNAIGFDSGFTYQPRKLEGFEARIGSYPYSARFVQMPFTAGYRVAADSILGYPYMPFAYFGGGVSRMQDGGLTHVATSPAFRPCWQTDIGLDLLYSRFLLRVVQISFRESYGSQATVRSIGLSAGIVYRIRH
jgi:hypothetical protein